MRLTKTEAGKKAISDRSIALSPRQRSALIIFNGERQLDEVLTMLVGIGFSKTDADHMISLGLLAEVDPPVAAKAAVAKVTEPLGGFVDLNEAQSRYKLAYPLATKLTASLGFKGFRLNLAVEAAGSYSQLVQ
ncbi:MAG: hypothetical protein RL018_470 [Pseudomonadota bacterium]|jgi:hypothetical protein